jgi:hypothetical protein
MTKYVFDDYVRATMGGATNASDGSRLTPAQVERVAAYLKSPGSGPDASTSYEAFVSRNMATHPPALPSGVSYVGFSGADNTGKSNYANAEDYTKEMGGGGRAGIIGDTPWGKFIDQSSANPDVDVISGKFKQFLTSEGIAPYGNNAKGALQDMMWNAGSGPFLENAVKSGHPVVAFVENAPLNRGFSTFELPTALSSPNTVMNGYPMSAFGPDPLTFASQSAAQYQQVERSLAQSATTHSGHAVSVADIRTHVDVANGYNATQKSLFGQPVDEFSRLNLDQMSAASKAWSAQRAASMAKAGPSETLPEKARVLEQHPPRGPPGPAMEEAVHVRASGLPESAGMVGKIEPGMAAKGLGALGAAAVVVDAVHTGRDATHLFQAGNPVGGQSAIIHFTGRNLGMLAGAEVVGGGAALAGVESGPGLVVFGLIGGVAGAVGGDKIATAIDNHRINNQSDKDGNSWHHDPSHPAQGWTRTVTEIDPKGFPNLEMGMPAYKSHTVTASPALTNTLNYKASNTAVDLALAHPNTPKDPYSQPPGKGDAYSIRDAEWTRDPQNQTWSRHVTDQVLEHGITIAHNETAGPVRAAQLNHAADQTIAGNLAQSPRGMAHQYQSAYEQYGWQKEGPMPASVSGALKTPANILQASDGHTYNRGGDGQWNTPGMIYGTNAAEGNVRNELNATLRAEQAQTHSSPLQPHATPPTPASHAATSSPTKTALEGVSPTQSHPPSPAFRHLSEKLNRISTAMENGDRAGLRKEAEPYVNSAEGRAFFAQAKATADSKEKALAGPSQPRDPREAGHPDHALNQSIREQLVTMHAKAGIYPSDDKIGPLTAAVALHARENRMTQVDQVQFNADKSGIIATQGSGNDGRSTHSITAVQQALQTPPEHAYQQMAQVTQQQAQTDQTRQQQAVQQQAMQPQQQGPSMGR